MAAALRGLVALTLCLGAATLAPVYRDAHYEVAIASDVAYASAMVNCTDQTDPATCVETSVCLDVYTPLYTPASVFGQLPVVMAVHGGAYTGTVVLSTQPQGRPTITRTLTLTLTMTMTITLHPDPDHDPDLHSHL